MINIEDKIITLIKYFETNEDILAVWLIGSYGTEYQREESDIDFSILFNKDVSILKEMKISCNISDIIGYENVDTVDLKKAPITLQFKTIKEGRSLYEADFIKTSDYIEYVINRFREEKYHIESFRKDYYESYSL
ncbi:nucleotidyltransferase domain-containing protein [Clostridium sp. CS001]|uniref:type VII toxin-antitoxin system MntA family adenylyltransferase antitoxin n=1 Tax=Clostridium sp. CS001 TaxID=2880648 RepID=UPI001CF10EFA|nr:nucleotidyltransferase domain-containing protein [Clostridium sp. CS001]MCB2290010.1 nucleotidyltransferase domain-containing protein [Clostridium sp. CS001]